MVASQGPAYQESPVANAIRGLLVVTSVAFALASLVHFGVILSLGPVTLADSFPGAAVPEAVIAVVLGVGALAVIAGWPGRWRLALGTSLFALLLTIYGFTVTVRTARIGDIVYHVGVLMALVVIVALLTRLDILHERQR